MAGRGADGDEHEVGAAAVAQPAHLLDHARLVCPQGVGGAEAAGRLELRVDDVERDDGPRSGDRRALDRVEADAPGPDHDRRRPGAERGRAGHRADAGDDSAGEQRGGVEREARRNDHGLRGVDHDLLGEGGGAQAVGQRLAVEPVQGAPGVQREPRLARHGCAPAAGETAPAGPDQRHDDVIADPETADALSNLGDHPRGLVSVDRGQRPAPAALGVDDVTVADRARGDLDPELAGTGRVQDDVLDGQRLAERPTDRRAHSRLREAEP